MHYKNEIGESKLSPLLEPYGLLSQHTYIVLQIMEDPVMTVVSVNLLPVGVLVYSLRKKKMESGGINLDQQIMVSMKE